MDWNLLLCPKRFGSEDGTAQFNDTRTHFQRDYDRVIFSSPFRRLQNKTQVFPLPGSVFVHNRLTHSLEVASVGRSLGNNVVPFIQEMVPSVPEELIEQIPTIIATACLAHDLGNPPFGHSGEDAIRAYFTSQRETLERKLEPAECMDLLRFEGNANAIRLLTQTLEGRRSGGFRLSYPVLASIAKYPWESTHKGSKKFGFFQTEKANFQAIASSMGIPRLADQPLAFARHPLVYLVEAADDICYQIMDVEDAHKLGILSSSDVHYLYLGFFNEDADKQTIAKVRATLNDVQDENEQIAFLRAITIGKLANECSKAFKESYSQIIEGVKVPPLIQQIDPSGKKALARITEVAIEKIYNHRTVVEIELAGFQIIGTLLDCFCKALLNPSDGYSKKIIRLIPPQFSPNNGSEYLQLMSAVDFISGMTDVFALEMYRTIKGISIPGITR